MEVRIFPAIFCCMPTFDVVIYELLQSTLKTKSNKTGTQSEMVYCQTMASHSVCGFVKKFCIKMPKVRQQNNEVEIENTDRTSSDVELGGVSVHDENNELDRRRKSGGQCLWE